MKNFSLECPKYKLSFVKVQIQVFKLSLDQDNYYTKKIYNSMNKIRIKVKYNHYQGFKVQWKKDVNYGLENQTGRRRFTSARNSDLQFATFGIREKPSFTPGKVVQEMSNQIDCMYERMITLQWKG